MGQITLHGEAEPVIDSTGETKYRFSLSGDVRIWAGVLGAIFLGSCMGVSVDKVVEKQIPTTPVVSVDQLVPVEFTRGDLSCQALSEDGSLERVIATTIDCVG